MKFLILSLLLASSLSFANYMCRVDLVDYRGYQISSFTAQSDMNGLCRDGLRDCNREKKLRGLQNATCQLRDNYSGGNNGGGYNGGGYNGGGYNGGGYNGGGYNQFQHLLSRTDYQLAQEASFGIGMCKIERGSWGNACDFYVKRAQLGYPQGTGCADSQYTSQYGCSSYDEFQNAGCMIRKAIMRGDC